MTRRLDSLFDVRYGHSLELNALKRAEAPDGVNFVSRAMGNNGVTARVVTSIAEKDLGHAGELSVALGGNGILSTFLQPEPFVCGRDVAILRAIKPMTDAEKLYWGRCIWHNRFKYSYGRQANRTLAALEVPDVAPDWVAGMEIPSIEGLRKPNGPRVAMSEVSDWGDFRIDHLFDIHKGKRLTKADRKPGTVRFIGASDKRNGVTDHIEGPAQFDGGCLTVPYNGSVGYAFYQDQPFSASDDVNVLVARSPRSRLQLLFVAAMIRHEKSRYSYGYKWNLDRMGPSTIRLPKDAQGEPDWEYMESVMGGMPFSRLVASR